MAEFLVSVSTGAMGSVLGKLGTMLSEEFKLLRGVRDDIKFLKDELEHMQAFLLVMAEEEKPDPQAKLRADEVREMSYEIEDNIDKFMVLLDREPTSMSDGFMKLFNKSMEKIKSIKTRHKIAKDFKDIKIQVKEMSDRYARYMINGFSRSEIEKVDPRLRTIYKDALELVGVEGPRDEIANWLSNKEGESSHQPKVVSIVGYGGLGKTTLARQVYEKLGTSYECRAFVSISRTPDMTKILSSMLSQLRNQDYAYAGDPQLIIDQIRNFLQDKRYFIIIDDLWDVQTWQDLNCALVRKDNGSGIMTTTRIHDVAKSCCPSDGNLVYKIEPLGLADSKELFFKRIFGCEEKCPPNLKQASEDILKKCGGLPLAINAISSLLASGKRKEDWERVRSSISFAQGKNSDIDAMNYILSLSYFDLPLCLRSCLLYLTMFPEDYEIGREQLVHRWIAEGFIHGKDGEDLVELGETYFHELVNRSLIHPVNIEYDGKVWDCRVHDIILDFLIYKSTEENFCTLLSNHSKPDSRVIRRLSLLGNEDQENVEQLDLSHARSLGAFGNSWEYLPSLAKSNALRVLDVAFCTGLGAHHVKDIGRLLQLRYLDISFTNITELPKEIGDLEYLDTLEGRATKLNELPESVTRLKRLARLFVPRETKFPDGIGKMENLQELGHSINMLLQSANFLEELGKLTNLRKLAIHWDSHKLDKASCKGKKLVSSLCKLDACKLRDLSVVLHLTEDDDFRGHTFPALNSIRDIRINHAQISLISKWLVSLINLEDLALDGMEIEQQDVEMVGSIPTLLAFRVLANCIGNTIVISGGFQQLRSLFLYWGNTKLMFEAGAMPNLEELVFTIEQRNYKSSGDGGCDDIGIQHLSSLALLHVMLDCSSVKAAVVEATEVSFKSMVGAHPNRPMLRMDRRRTDRMLKDDDMFQVPAQSID
ncbi:putative disease resistance RPP13-like protein 3 [Brachypodium distachyon]|uniref:Uncharacterized protein n=1 Tax=Brachypodium distachyon TaxID=15368 RepID=I1HN35_BRADI|nr:putative disease resistance RPP13-like protein 3 [Brachypodium distachyon]KQK08072.2 hypothetical protein BRADI_2g39537v3 [Brachypodium distachyon]|eukprot:XP_003569117.1 putative disease resistance RPP13-like protein 3 [Brachypodium distachyon]